MEKPEKPHALVPLAEPTALADIWLWGGACSQAVRGALCECEQWTAEHLARMLALITSVHAITSV
jgi:hypothetical protein